MSHSKRRAALVAPFIAAVCCAVLAGGGVAKAANATTVEYSCSIDGAEPFTHNVNVDVTAPATAVVGSKGKVTVSIEMPEVVNPTDLPDSSVTGSIVLNLGSAGSGSVTASGLTNVGGTPAGAPLRLTGGSATVSFTTPGDVTFAPGSSIGKVKGTPGEMVCTPVGTPGIAATTRVS